MIVQLIVTDNVKFIFSCEESEVRCCLFCVVIKKQN